MSFCGGGFRLAEHGRGLFGGVRAVLLGRWLAVSRFGNSGGGRGDSLTVGGVCREVVGGKSIRSVAEFRLCLRR